MQKLRREWIFLLLGVLVFLTSFFLLFYRTWNPLHAWRWLALAAGFSAWQLIFLRRNLHLNQRDGDSAVLLNLGVANLVSFVRGIFIGALFGFLFSPWPAGGLGWLPFAFYLLASLADILDGYLARITNHVTALGGALDMENDSWGVLIVTGLVFWYGQVPFWYLPVGLARYIFIFGLWWREKQSKENLELPFSYRRRIFAGVQMGFIVSMLAPVFSPPATTIAATLFMLPFLLGFLYDWFLVTGGLTPQQGTAFSARIASVKGLGIIPFILRFFVVWSLGAYLPKISDQVLQPHSAFLGILWYFFTFAALPTLLFGAVGRLGAIFALISTGMAFNVVYSQSFYTLLLGASTVLFFAGTGIFSLWSPEDWLIYNRAGERHD